MITLVGAGLVGSLWALLLAQKGHQVQVFEKRGDPRIKGNEVGRSINLVITSRGLYGLEKAGLLNKVKDLAVPVYGRMIHAKTGELNYQPYGRKNEYNLSISRGELNQFLLQEAEDQGVRFFFNHELEGLDPKNKTLSFNSSGRKKTASYDLLFATDGSGSRVRKELHRLKPNLFEDHTEWLEADYKELTMPLFNGKAPMDRQALHIWPRGAHMMMGLANRDGSFTMTLYLPKKASSWSFAKIQNEQDIRDLFASEFPDAISLMPDYVSEFLHNPQGTLGTVRCSQWVFEDSIALMGDAAHGIVPFFGQGMNCGFEDCTTLLELMEQEPNKNWPQLLKQYEEARKLNADAIADMALENWVEMRDRVGDKKFLAQKKLEALLEDKFPNLYKSRYGLITYTLVPYALAQKAGLVQKKILDDLMSNYENPEDIPLENLTQSMEKYWKPFLQSHNLKVTHYIPLSDLS